MHRRASSAALVVGSAFAAAPLNRAGPPGMIEYLNRDAIRTNDSPR